MKKIELMLGMKKIESVKDLFAHYKVLNNYLLKFLKFTVDAFLKQLNM